MSRLYVVDATPVSTNHAYIPHRFKPTRYLSKEACALIEAVHGAMKKKDEECGGPLDLDKTGLTPYDSRYTFYFPKSTLYTLDGRIRRRNDVSNCIKVVEDAVMKYLDSNDGFVMDMKLQKRLSWDDAVHIIIEIGAKGSLFSESKDPHEGIVDRASS